MSATLHPNAKLLEIEDHPGADVVVLREDVRQVAVVNTLEDARRLVACWNAFQGMRSEHIEELASTGLVTFVNRLMTQCHQLTKERNDLAVAVEMLARRASAADIAKLIGESTGAAARPLTPAEIEKLKGGAA